MPVFPALGAALSVLTVAILQSNEIIPAAVKKYVLEDEDIVCDGQKPKVKIDGFFYPQLMHGPGRHYRPILTGNDPFMTQSSAYQASELLLKYARQLEPVAPDHYPPEEQLRLFPPEALPEYLAA